MKENWINKLIKLLNEYDDWMVSWYEEYFPTEWLFVTNAGQWFREEFILGKRYWFIQRLVENDKIDTYKLEKIWYEKTVCRYDWQYIEIVEYSDYESLLMLLSISDTPISDLISYLK